MSKNIEKLVDDVVRISATIRVQYQKINDRTLFENANRDSLIHIPNYYIQICLIIKNLRRLTVKEKYNNFKDLYRLGAHLEKNVNKLNTICEFLRAEYINKRHDLADVVFYENCSKWSEKAIFSLEKFLKELIQEVKNKDNEADNGHNKQPINSLITEPESEYLIEREIELQKRTKETKVKNKESDYPDHPVNPLFKDPLKLKGNNGDKKEFVELVTGAFVKRTKIDDGSSNSSKSADSSANSNKTTTGESGTPAENTQKNGWGVCLNFDQLFGSKKEKEIVTTPLVWSFTTSDIFKEPEQSPYESEYEKLRVYETLHQEGMLSANDELVYKQLKQRFAKMRLVKSR